MTKISAETLERYQEILRKDPKSKVFAALSDALREHGDSLRAELIAKEGLKNHPEYIGGYVALGRILTEQKRSHEALPLLTKAIRIAPDNLLAYQLLGQIYLDLEQPKDALKAHKMALFLNPQSKRSQQVVQKLEALTASEYEEDLFQMSPLAQALETLHPETSAPNKSSPPRPDNQNLSSEDAQRKKERQLSVIDALMVRNELQKAGPLVEELFWLFPEDPEVRKRWELLKDLPEEQADELRPLLSREREVVNRQVKSLEKILGRLQEVRRLEG